MRRSAAYYSNRGMDPLQEKDIFDDNDQKNLKKNIIRSLKPMGKDLSDLCKLVDPEGH